MKLSDLWSFQRWVYPQDEELLKLHGGFLVDFSFPYAFAMVVGVYPDFFRIVDDILIPRLPQHANSLWRYGHRPGKMIYCNDLVLAEVLGERYVPRSPYQDLFSMGIEEDR